MCRKFINSTIAVSVSCCFRPCTYVRSTCCEVFKMLFHSWQDLHISCNRFTICLMFLHFQNNIDLPELAQFWPAGLSIIPMFSSRSTITRWKNSSYLRRLININIAEVLCRTVVQFAVFSIGAVCFVLCIIG